MKRQLLALAATSVILPGAALATTPGLHARIRDASARVISAVFPGQAPLLAPLAEADPDARQKELDAEMLFHAEFDRFETVQRLLIAGARVDAQKDFSRATALMYAVSNHRAWAVRMLLEHKASVGLTDVFGRTALMRVSSGYGRHEAGEILDLLLAKGADIEARDRDGNTALLLAADSGPFDEPELVSLLLDRSASPLAANQAGETALMRAARKGRLGIVSALLAKGADANARNAKGATALMLAVEEGRLPLADFLSKLPGADLNLKDAEGGTALLRAAKTGDPALVKLLLERGAEINLPGRPARDRYAPDLREATALMVASLEGKIDVVRLLIGNRAGLDFRDGSTGHTALSLARLYGADPAHQAIVKLLVEAGASDRIY